eukprot:5014232-Amphidinium_carterae.1
MDKALGSVKDLHAFRAHLFRSCASGFHRVAWTVDGKKLRQSDKQFVSPTFNLSIGEDEIKCCRPASPLPLNQSLIMQPHEQSHSAHTVEAIAVCAVRQNVTLVTDCQLEEGLGGDLVKTH